VKRLLRASKTMTLPESIDQMTSLEEAFPIPAAIKQQLKLRTCGNLACNKERKFHEAKYLKCAGCLRVSYCGEACQRVDWKHRHKKVCKKALRRRKKKK
jgi:hypothetical protein